MTYTPYVDVENFQISHIPYDERKALLIKVSRHIDTLTFNRIAGRFKTLTAFQKEVVEEVCTNLAVWEYDNSELLESTVKSYSINGVSLEFGGANIRQVSGVFIPDELYNRLCQTGLCCRKI